jgi:hypothetical protein
MLPIASRSVSCGNPPIAPSLVSAVRYLSRLHAKLRRYLFEVDSKPSAIPREHSAKQRGPTHRVPGRSDSAIRIRSFPPGENKKERKGLTAADAMHSMGVSYWLNHLDPIVFGDENWH